MCLHQCRTGNRCHRADTCFALSHNGERGLHRCTIPWLDCTLFEDYHSTCWCSAVADLFVAPQKRIFAATDRHHTQCRELQVLVWAQPEGPQWVEADYLFQLVSNS